MSKLQLILDGTIKPGVYRFPSKAKAETLQAEAAEQGWRCFYLDGNTIADKASFLAVARQAFALPGYAGKNWDAFEECLNDLAWAPADGYVVVYDDAANLAGQDLGSWTIALNIFRSAVGNWTKDGKPMYVLLRQAGRLDEPLAEWPDA